MNWLYILLLTTLMVTQSLGDLERISDPQIKGNLDSIHELQKREVSDNSMKPLTEIKKEGIDKCVEWAFSMFDKIVTVFLQPKSKEALNIIHKLHNCSETIKDRLDEQLDFFQLYLITDKEYEFVNYMDSHFDDNVFNPLMAVIHNMKRMMEWESTEDEWSIHDFYVTNSGVNTDIFVAQILDHSKWLFLSMFNATNYNETVFVTMRDKFSMAVLETIAARSFSVAIYPASFDVTDTLDVLKHEALEDRQEFAKLMTEITESFYNGTLGPLEMKDLDMMYPPESDHNSTKETLIETSNRTVVSCLEWGVSSLEAITVAFSQNDNNDTTVDIINETLLCFEELLKQLPLDLANLDIFIEEKSFDFFEIEVFTTMRAVTKKMMRLMKNVSDKQTLKPFLLGHDGAKMSIVMAHITLSKWLIFHITNDTNYNETVFLSAKHAWTTAFLQTAVVRAFRWGVDYGKGALKLNKLYDLAERKEFTTMIEEAEEDFYQNFFPGTIRENFIQKVVDKHIESSNCAISHIITNKLHVNYPWRHFAVIVSNEVNDENYHLIGFPGKFIEEDYKSKKIFVFLVSENFQENFQHYHAKLDTAKIQSANLKDSRDLKSLTEHANMGNNNQMIVMKTSFESVCLYASHNNATDSFIRSFRHRSSHFFAEFERIDVFQVVIF